MEDINTRILKNIKDSDFDPAIKDFLRRVLLLELQNFEEYRWRFKDSYDREIVRCSDKLELEK